MAEFQLAAGPEPKSAPTRVRCFIPSWEILPHEAKLPHADVISERLETLVALAEKANGKNAKAPLVVTNVAALLQRTFPRAKCSGRARAR